MTQCGTSVTRDFLGKIVHRFDRGSEAGSCNAHIEVSIMHELACMLVSDCNTRHNAYNETPLVCSIVDDLNELWLSFGRPGVDPVLCSI